MCSSRDLRESSVCIVTKVLGFGKRDSIEKCYVAYLIVRFCSFIIW